jgi:hypothetical protein
MSDTFREMTKYDKERRQRNLEHHQQSKLPWHKFTQWHWRIDLQGDSLDLWPSKNKLMSKHLSATACRCLTIVINWR